MPESLIVSIGQAGNQIAKQFWTLGIQEQLQQNTFDESCSTFYRNADLKNGKASMKLGSKIKSLKARGILIDMEEGVIGSIKKSKIGDLFDQDQIVTSNSGSGNNWAQGYHQYGNEFREEMLEVLRKQAEYCDTLQSIITIQSSGGGTGSGLGSAFSELLMDEMPSIWRFGVSVVPSPNDDVVTSPYNSVLSLSKLSESFDCILPLDNQSLMSIFDRISSQSLKKPSSSLIDNGNPLLKVKKLFDVKNQAFDMMNNIVANLILNMTSSMRFEGAMNVDINDIVTNLVPFPKLNFLTSSMTPFCISKEIGRLQSSNTLDLAFKEAFLPESQLLSIDPRQSVFLASAIIGRGSIEISDLRRNIDKIRKHLKFVPWNQDGWKTGLCDVAPLGQSYSILALSNNTGFWKIADRLLTRFNKLYKRNAHIHHYLDFIDRYEFDHAKSTVTSILKEYKELEI
jgi:tubulin epsilon